MLEIATLKIHRAQSRRWREGDLAEEWAERFPDLFDEDDRRLVANQKHLGFHFVEWLAAIVLHHTTGYLSLVGKYEFEKHARKRELIESMLPTEGLAALDDRETHGRTQAPDLFMFAPDRTDWFFCEVKGPRDSLRPAQAAKFETLASATGRPIRLLTMKWASGSGSKEGST
ncbi:MAG: VRR-NUC domain-containing protein [Solirubrobacterales bacterium]